MRKTVTVSARERQALQRMAVSVAGNGKAIAKLAALCNDLELFPVGVELTHQMELDITVHAEALVGLRDRVNRSVEDEMVLTVVWRALDDAWWMDTDDA